MVHFYTRISFLGGFLLGVILAIILKNYLETGHQVKQNTYESWFKKQGLIRKKHIPWDTLRYKNTTSALTLESQFLFDKIRILCAVLIKNVNNVKAAEDTWLRGCNKVNYVYLTTNKLKLKTKLVPEIKKRRQEDSSWVILCNNLMKIPPSAFEWVLVVNDNTFVIMENLRYYVAALIAEEKHYLGHVVSFWGTLYNTGEAGYVLSRGALKVLQRNAKESRCITNSYWNREDFYLGRHLANLNITPVDTRDEDGLSTFHPYNWYHVFFPGENYYKSSFFPRKCCSKRSITFQAIESDKMYTYYYLLYTLQIFSHGNFGNVPPPSAGPDDMIWKQFLKERGIQSDKITSNQYYQLWESLIQDPNSFAKNLRKEQDFDYEN